MKRKLTSGLSTVLGAIALPLLFAGPANAALFANQFVEFELPPLWQCSLEGAEWVCQSTEEAKKKDAIIVLAAKLKGDQDSAEQYLTYLQSPKSYTSIQGKPVKSEIKYAKNSAISGQAWIDSLHLDSEIPGFYTRYLATVKADIGVLVTYSINKNKYQTYLNEFETMVRTLKVFRRPGGINVAPASGNLFNQAQIPAGVGAGTVFPATNVGGGADEAPKSKEDDGTILIIAAVAAVGLFLLWRKRRNNSDY